MKNRNLRTGLLLIPAVLWAALTAFAWFAPVKDISEAERRPLAQMPEISADTLLSGSFMEKFDDFVLDQFPLRDSFRTIKALFHFYGLQQSDNNDIYIADGYAVKQEYPLNMDSVSHALDRFQHLYDKYLASSGSDIHMAIIPDKGYYLAEKSGHLTLDYEVLFSAFETGMPWADFIDLTDALSIEDYYRTDIHWRQEMLPDAAGVICDHLGVTPPEPADFPMEEIERPFYGVYYGQAALPMEPETMYFRKNNLLDSCWVYNYETGKYGRIFDLSKRDSRDLYDIFLSGPQSLLTIENPHASTDRELILFRDSFGSSMAPLLVQDYAKVTLVDIRYIQIDILDRFLEFDGQDVLFLYSVPVLNNSQTIK